MLRAGCLPAPPYALHHSRWEWLRGAARCGVSLLLLGVCSCAPLDARRARKTDDRFLAGPPGNEARPFEKAGLLEAQRQPAIQPVTYDEPARVAKPATGEPSDVRNTAQVAGPVAQFFPAEDRVVLNADDVAAINGHAQMVRNFPDEYLFDGGDRGLPIHFDQFNMLGLETEDTIAQYNDDEGRRHIKPSTRVAVYAPRFAAVTTVSAPTEGVAIGRLAGAKTTQQGSGLRNRQTTVAQAQRQATERMVVRSRSSGLETQTRQHEVAQPIVIAANQKTVVSHQDFAFVRSGTFLRTEEAWLAGTIQSAGIWTRDQNPVIAATNDSAGALEGRFVVSEYVGFEPKLSKPGELRIVKLADRKTAVPGDVITFTIRYDNLGDREVRNVVIVDNLTPRLTYVDDSATSDRDGRMDTSDNNEGSSILRWELDAPLPGKTGGVVTFQALVR